MFLTGRSYVVLVVVAVIMAAGMLFPPLFVVGQWLLLVVVVAAAAEALTLFTKARVGASRKCAERFSLGDDNEVVLRVANRSPFGIDVRIIDELPEQFQKRDFLLRLRLGKGGTESVSYSLRPTERGAYHFGKVLVFASTRLRLIQRRFSCGEEMVVKVYPSFLKLRQYLMAASANNLSETGTKRVRRAGNNTDFEQIRDYVQGDDYRTINWKATARRTHLMVNVYQDERSQEIYSLIDKGRLMQQSFLGMTLLDYAINSSLVLSYVAMSKQDKAGIVTFADVMDTFVPAGRQSMQMPRILEALYAQQTTFGETDYSMLCPNLNKLVARRSFMVLYTNFTDFGALQRQLEYLRLLNKRHRLLVVFFDDIELSAFANSPKRTEEDYYQHVIAEKLIYERRLIQSTLRQNGIYSVITNPKAISADVINKYMEMKSRHLLV
ncbi:MAG: DUF58 domain-containing protein [Prevotella sp.]|nr:DUF58 domain-containing protein [Prevotella sp.]